jgi:kinesin family protein 26
MSVMSDTERYKAHYAPPVGAGVLPRPYFDHEDFLEQETRHKFDQLARLHELYQSKLALANVSNSVTYQRENSSTVNVRDAPCKFRRVLQFNRTFARTFVRRKNPPGIGCCLLRVR